MYNKYFNNKILLSLVFSFSVHTPIYPISVPSLEDIRKILNDPIVSYTFRTAITVLPILVPLLSKKYNIFTSEKELAHQYTIWQQLEITNNQEIESNEKNLAAKDIENAQERLVVIYRSKQLLDDYETYVVKIPAHSPARKEAEKIYTDLIIKYGKNYADFLANNKVGIEKIEKDYKENLESVKKSAV